MYVTITPLKILDIVYQSVWKITAIGAAAAARPPPSDVFYFLAAQHPSNG